MKVQIQIPRGWKRIRKGMILKDGDRSLSLSDNQWAPIQSYLVDYYKVGTLTERGYSGYMVDLFIRKINKQKNKRRNSHDR
jgi:hypothetical protein